jgi:hypothetical protein
VKGIREEEFSRKDNKKWPGRVVPSTQLKWPTRNIPAYIQGLWSLAATHGFSSCDRQGPEPELEANVNHSQGFSAQSSQHLSSLERTVLVQSVFKASSQTSCVLFRVPDSDTSSTTIARAVLRLHNQKLEGGKLCRLFLSSGKEGAVYNTFP